MAQVTLTIAGRSYGVGCRDGEEEHLRTLAHEVDRRARAMTDTTGAVAEGLILVLTALMLADEVSDARAATAPLEGEVADLKSRVSDLVRQVSEGRSALQQAQQHLEQRRDETADRERQEEDVARAIDALAARIETVAERFTAT